MGCGSSGGCCTQAVAFQSNLGTRGGDIYEDGSSPTVRVGSSVGIPSPPAVAFTKSKRAQSTTDDETWVPGEVSPTMSCFDQGDTRATTVVAFTQNCRDEVLQINGDGQIAGALSADSGSHQTNYVAYDITGTLATNAAKPTDVHVPLRSLLPGQSEASTTTVVAFDTFNQTVNYEVNQTIDAGGGSAGGGRGHGVVMEAMAVRRLTPRETDCLPASGHSDGSHQGVGVAVPIQHTAWHQSGIGSYRNPGVGVGKEGDPAYTVETDARSNGVATAMAVRRLTPRECERLQGFPDDYTLVEYRKKPAADGPRYRALGNSMAVPVMRWIGERIAMVDRIECP
jgi:DNA (cytosine-5)-methyltransferase 1